MQVPGQTELKTGFARRLRLARIASGYLTARAFAEQLGIDQNTYTPYERGRSYPSAHTLAQIRALTKVTMDWLFLGDESHLPLQVYRALQETEKALADEDAK